MIPINRFLVLALLLTAPVRAGSLLPPGARVAVIGDSITEQKLYSKYIEAYLLACTGRTDVRVFQFGWSGERAGGFAARLENDLSVFRPNVATTCYGMNDGSYTPYAPQIGMEYEKNMRLVLNGLKAAGVQVIAVGSPGAVDPGYFVRPTLKGEVYNENLAQLRDIASKLAQECGQPFANVHDTMLSALAPSKTALGKPYAPFGSDGFHPAPAGQLLMAQAFLKALGCDGEIGVISVDCQGAAQGSPGHHILSSRDGVTEVESSRWPFCFDADASHAGSTRSILPFCSFNQDLNRLVLRVKNLPGAKAKITWGGECREFSRESLEAGVNLAAEFVATPFQAPFQELLDAIATKQALETVMIKNLITHFRGFASDASQDAEFAAALNTLKTKLTQKQTRLDELARSKVVPVRHTLVVEPGA